MYLAIYLFKATTLTGSIEIDTNKLTAANKAKIEKAIDDEEEFIYLDQTTIETELELARIYINDPYLQRLDIYES